MKWESADSTTKGPCIQLSARDYVEYKRQFGLLGMKVVGPELFHKYANELWNTSTTVFDEMVKQTTKKLIEVLQKGNKYGLEKIVGDELTRVILPSKASMPPKAKTTSSKASTPINTP